MGWLNWNDDPRDDENETEVRGAIVYSMILFALVMITLVLAIK